MTSDPAQPVSVGASRASTVPLSRTQQLIWTSQRLHPDVPVANMGTQVRIAGTIDPDRFVRAFDEVVTVCDVLRTVVSGRPGDEQATVLRKPPRETEVVDIGVDELDAWGRERIAVPIDAGTCVYDSVLIRHAPDDWTWWLDLHHVATDAWASALVYRATAVAYEQLALGVEVDLSGVVDGSFTAGVAALADDRGGRTTAEERAAAWDVEIAAAGVQPPIEPYGPRGPRGTEVERLRVPVDGDALAAALGSDYRTISRELALLTFGVMSSALAVHRLDGRHAVIVGVPVHHRSSRRARRLVGPLMELYPLTIEIDPAETHAEMFARVLRRVTELLRRAKPGESPANAFEVVVNVLTASYGDFAGHPASASWMRSGHVDPNHVLRTQIFDYGGGVEARTLRWELDVNTSLADPTARRRLPEHVGAIVAAIAARPEGGVCEVALPGPAELAELQRLSPEPEPVAHDAPAHEIVRRQLERDPDAVVVEHGAVVTTAAEFDRRADGLAAWLVDAGLPRGAIVGLRLPRSVDVLIGIHGIHRAGGAFVLLDPTDPPARHELIAADADLFAILDEIPQSSVELPAPSLDVGLDDLAYVLYTSGSTGVPKGVPITHRGLVDYLRFAVDAYVDDVPPVVALHSSLAFDLTITSLFLAPMTGGRTIVVDGEPVTALGAIAADDRITFLKATPSQLELFVRMVDRPRPLRTVVVGGEAFRRPNASRLVEACRPGVRIFNEYGPTEAVVGCMIHRWSPEDDTGVDVPVGAACPGADLRVLDPYRRPTPSGSWGELYVRRPGMAVAYLHRPDQTAERFVTLPNDVDPHGRTWYRTGDRCRVERPGVAVYGGRMDDQLKVNGIRLEPAEVEAALVAIDGVESALVRIWTPADRQGLLDDAHRCVRCGLGVDVPGVELDGEQVCSTCRRYDEVAPQTTAWFRSEADLDERRDAARRRRTGVADCLHLLSGGKDSTYALYQLVDRGWDVHALTLDNGFISDGAKANIRSSVADLGITHEFVTVEAMNEIFRDSLDRYSNVCQGCYKTIYTVAVQRARQLGIPVIVTGLSRGQFFETRLVPHQFESGRFDPDEIDQTVLEARRVYHQTRDAVTELLPEQRVFDDISVLDELEFLDFYRYVDVDLAEMYRTLESRAPWVRPADTGRSTNCLINVAGIQVHRQERGFHNYAEPYSWDVRLGHKTRDEALEELDDVVDDVEVARLLSAVGYEPKTNGVLTAWYRTADGLDRDPAELRSLLRDRLPDHAVPRAFVRVDEVPLAASAKADPSLLPPPERFHRPGTGAVAPTTGTEARLCEIWCGVLGLDAVGITDDFFDLGGASLDALEVVAAIDVEYGTDLHDAAVFRARTVRELAHLVDGAPKSGDARRPLVEVDPESPAPLSAGEEAMLFEYRLDPTDTRYNVTRRYTVVGEFDEDRFAAAVRSVVDIHGPLHTSFAADRRRLAIDRAVEFDWLGDVTAADVDRSADRLRTSPFDLDDGPLVRVAVGRLGAGRWAVLLGLHHITIDAGTFDVLWNQVVDRYGTGALPDLPTSFAAFGEWQRQQPESSREFWLARSRARLDVARLAVAAPDPAEEDGYVSTTVELGPDELRRGSATPFAAAMAAAAAVFGRFTGRPDVEFGITASTKNHSAAAPLVGYTLNTLPVSLRAEATRPFGELVADATATVTGALDHRTYPFADIVRDARAAGLVPPDVSLMVAFEELAPARFPGGDAEHRILASGTAVADATLFVQEREHSVEVGIEYRGRVIGRRDAERMLAGFEAALVGGLRSPDRTVGALIAGVVPAGDLSGDPLEVDLPTVPASIVEWAATTPTAVSVVGHNGDSVTYGQLVTAAVGLADRIGPARGARVGVAVERSPDMVVAMLAAMLAGAVYVPLDPSSPTERLRLIAEQADLRAVIVGDATTDPARAAELFGVGADRVVGVGGVDGVRSNETAIESAVQRAGRVEPDDPAYLIFTSGSTGVPRGVEVRHRNLTASTAARASFYPRPPERFLLTPSIGFDSSIVGLVWPLVAGGAVVVAGDDDVRDVDRLGALVAALGVDHVLMVPSLYRALIERRGADLLGLKVAIVAGEACPRSLIDLHRLALPGVDLVNEYGPTEATVWATAHRVPSTDATGDDGPVPIGRPIAGTTVRIAADDAETLPAGVAGELWISSPGVVDGYLGGVGPDRFVTADSRRWYRTGDLARADDDGVLTFVGRIDDQLNVGGVRVEPEEIERQLRSLDGVRDAAVVVAGDPPVLVAHVEADRFDEAEARRRLRDHVVAAAMPRRFVAHRHLPRTAHGKLDRAAAAAMPVPETPTAGDHAGAVDDRASLSATIVGIWREVLGRSDVEHDSDFFAIGGDSLAAVAIVTAVGDSVGRTVPIAALLTARTPAGLAHAIGGDGDAPVPDASFHVVTLRPGRPGGPLVLVTPVWDEVFGYQDLAAAFGPDVRVEALAYVEQPGTAPVTTVAVAVDHFLPAALGLTAGAGAVAVVGWSVGGVVAAELGERLVAAGVDVAAVGLVDTFFPGEARHVWSNRWWKYKSMLGPGSRRAALDEFATMGLRRVKRLSGSVGRRLVVWSGGTVVPEPVRTKVGTFPPESLTHPIGRVSTRIVLYRASTTNPRRTIDRWRSVAPHLDDVVIEGRHRGFRSIMAAGRVREIANDIADRLDRS